VTVHSRGKLTIAVWFCRWHWYRVECYLYQADEANSVEGAGELPDRMHVEIMVVVVIVIDSFKFNRSITSTRVFTKIAQHDYYGSQARAFSDNLITDNPKITCTL